MKGFILLHREILEHWIHRNPKECLRWIDLLALASYQDKVVPLGDMDVFVRRGQILTTTRQLQGMWNTNAKTVLNILKKLEKNGMIKAEKSTQNTIITIVNYDKYQDPYKYFNDIIEEDLYQDFDEIREREGKHTKRNNNKIKTINLNDEMDEKNFFDEISTRFKIEQACISLNITEEQYLSFAKEIISDWKYADEKDVTLKHFLNTMRVKVNRMKETQRKLQKKNETQNFKNDAHKQDIRRGNDVTAESSDDYKTSF